MEHYNVSIFFKCFFSNNWNLLDLAPEILNTEGYDETLDIWCLGIITFELLFAKSPFESQTEDPEGVLDRIAIVDFQFFEEEGLKISDSAKDFIRKVSLELNNID